ncbi:hypothetical protein B0H14DRAFT_2587608 [Mycena olivaceomarginata]|nr:hypothetical protein B0H14DRAFT_2587608 [Mycena olivaceomarginata]
MRAARLNWSDNWKAQSTTKLSHAFDGYSIEDDFPELRQFNGQWGVNRIAKDVWDNRKTYIHCVHKPSIYVSNPGARMQAPPVFGLNRWRLQFFLKKLAKSVAPAVWPAPPVFFDLGPN